MRDCNVINLERRNGRRCRGGKGGMKGVWIEG